MIRPHRPRSFIVGLALSGVVATGCVSTSDAATPPPAPSPDPSSPRPSPAPSPWPDPIAVDWDEPSVDPAAVPDGWALEPCVDGATILCVLDDRGAPVGTIELGRWTTTEDVDAISLWLRDQVEQFVDTFVVDRATGCGQGYTFGLDGDVIDVVIDGAPGVTYRYVGTDADGTVHERGMSTLVLRGDEVFWISAVAYDPAGCVPTTGGEFAPDVLARFAPVYLQLVRGSSLPGP